MLRINLLGEEKDRSAAYAVHAITCVSIGLLLSAFGIWFVAEQSLTLGQLESEIVFKKERLSSLKKLTEEVDTLEAKQKVLKEKLGVIAQLKLRKQGPVRVLDELTTKIPEKVWLTSISQNADILSLSGVALDGQTISLFMNQIKESQFVSATETVDTEIFVEDGLKLQKFKFPAKLSFGVSLSPESGDKAQKGDKKDKNK